MNLNLMLTCTGSLGPFHSLGGSRAAVRDTTFITEEFETQTRRRQIYVNLNMQVCSLSSSPGDVVVKQILVQQGWGPRMGISNELLATVGHNLAREEVTEGPEETESKGRMVLPAQVFRPETSAPKLLCACVLMHLHAYPKFSYKK